MALFSLWFLAVATLNSGFSNREVIQPELLFLFRNWKWSIQIYSCTIHSHPSLTNFISTILQRSPTSSPWSSTRPQPIENHGSVGECMQMHGKLLLWKLCMHATIPSPPSLPPPLPVHQAKKLGTTAVLYLYHAYIPTYTFITLLLFGVNNFMLSAEDNKR